LFAIINLIETQKDESPIIDTKGTIRGKLSYSVILEAFDVDLITKINLLEFETLNDLIGKYLKVTISLNRASELAEKFKHKSICRYSFNDEKIETNQVENSREPNFNFKHSHMLEINEGLIQSLMLNTITIGVFGQTEQKKKVVVQDTKLSFASSTDEMSKLKR
jgi:hypothetical protein